MQILVKECYIKDNFYYRLFSNDFIVLDDRYFSEFLITSYSLELFGEYINTISSCYNLLDTFFLSDYNRELKTYFSIRLTYNYYD